MTRKMDVDAAFVPFLAGEEGQRNKAYQDAKGIWTIGIGHTGQEVREGLEWTDAQVAEALRSDVATAVEGVNRLVRTDVTQQQFDALVSFAFNEGVHALSVSDLLKHLNSGDYPAAAKGFLGWERVGSNPTMLHKRRTDEMNLFLSGGNDEARA